MYLYVLPVLNEDFMLNPTCFEKENNEVLDNIMQCVNQSRTLSTIMDGIKKATVPEVISIHKAYISHVFFCSTLIFVNDFS